MKLRQGIQAMGDIKQVLSDLLAYAENQTCSHESTHRGGAIWEICDDCGAKWADDQGGKPEYVRPPEFEAAEQMLKEISATEADAVAVVENYQAVDKPNTIIQKVKLLRSVPNGSHLYLK